jgi:anti-sigma factor ChrR (cupin superfamily)
MTRHPADAADGVEFDALVALALALAAAGPSPRPEVRARLLARLEEEAAAATPPGFFFRFARDDRWLPHPVPGIRMRVLALNERAGYATLLLDVAPGTRFPAHHHHGAEECYVISGSLETCGRRMGPGDFLHADSDTDHGELWTDEGCQVLLVVPPDDYLPGLP